MGTRGRAHRVRAAKESAALLLAVHWSRVDDVLKQAGDLSAKVIVSCLLPMNAANTELVVPTPPRARRRSPRRFGRPRSSPPSALCPSEVLFGVFEARRKDPAS